MLWESHRGDRVNPGDVLDCSLYVEPEEEPEEDRSSKHNSFLSPCFLLVVSLISLYLRRNPGRRIDRINSQLRKTQRTIGHGASQIPALFALPTNDEPCDTRRPAERASYLRRGCSKRLCRVEPEPTLRFYKAASCRPGASAQTPRLSILLVKNAAR